MIGKRIKIYLLLATIIFSSLLPYRSVLAKVDKAFFENNDILFYDPGDSEDIICVNDGTAVSSLSGTTNKEKIWNYFIARGLSPEQTAGVIGNLMAESGLDPARQEGGKPWPTDGYGVSQETNQADGTGGRAELVKYLIKKLGQQFMDTYYKDEYGHKYDEATGVPAGMPIEANDKLLLAELDFLVESAQKTKIYRYTVLANEKYGWFDARTVRYMTRWDAMKVQSTVTQASNMWLYEMERPRSILTVEIVPWDPKATPEESKHTREYRADFGQDVFNLLSGSAASGGSTSCLPSGELNPDKIAVAKEIIANQKISYSETAENDIERTISDIANKVTNGAEGLGAVNVYVLNMINTLGKNHKIKITSLNRYGGGDGSHYSGSAFDIGMVDGIVFTDENKAWDPNEKSAAKIVLTTIGSYLLEANRVMTNKSGNKSTVGQSKEDKDKIPPQVNCGADSVFPQELVGQVRTLADTCHHIHIAVPISADPSLAGFK